MPRKQYQKVARAQILAELGARGIGQLQPSGASRVEIDEANGLVWITVDDADIPTADQVVAAHDATVVDAAAQADREAFRQDRQLLIAFQQNGSPTQAQAVGAIKAQTRMLQRFYNVLTP